MDHRSCGVLEVAHTQCADYARVSVFHGDDGRLVVFVTINVRPLGSTNFRKGMSISALVPASRLYVRARHAASATMRITRNALDLIREPAKGNAHKPHKGEQIRRHHASDIDQHNHGKFQWKWSLWPPVRVVCP